MLTSSKSTDVSSRPFSPFSFTNLRLILSLVSCFPLVFCFLSSLCTLTMQLTLALSKYFAPITLMFKQSLKIQFATNINVFSVLQTLKYLYPCSHALQNTIRLSKSSLVIMGFVENFVSIFLDALASLERVMSLLPSLRHVFWDCNL